MCPVYERQKKNKSYRKLNCGNPNCKYTHRKKIVKKVYKQEFCPVLFNMLSEKEYPSEIDPILKKKKHCGNEKC